MAMPLPLSREDDDVAWVDGRLPICLQQQALHLWVQGPALFTEGRWLLDSKFVCTILVGFWMRGQGGGAADVLGVFDEEEKAHQPHGGHDGPRDDEGQAPARGHPVTSNQGAQNVAHGGVGVPDPHDQTPPSFPKPVAEAGDHAGPASGLHQSVDDLSDHVEPQTVDIVEIAQPKQGSKGSAGEHPKSQVVPDGQALPYYAAEVHPHGVGT